MSQMACMDNEGLFHRAVVMSAMIRSPYQVGGIGVPEELWLSLIHILRVERRIMFFLRMIHIQSCVMR